MLLTKEIEMVWSSNKSIYEPRGYAYTKQGNTFIVKIEDLALNSSKSVLVKCDYCGKEYFSIYSNYNKYKSKNTVVDKDACNDCKNKKLVEINQILYGCNSVHQKDISIEKVRQEFAERGYKLISDTYVSNCDKLQYKCLKHCDEIFEIMYRDFKYKNNGCPRCGKEEMAKKQRLPFEKVVALFESYNYKIPDDFVYESAHKKISYRCSKHPDVLQSTAYTILIKGHGCKFCGFEKMQGEKHPNWQGGRTPFNRHTRCLIREWKDLSKSEFNYKCVFTGKRFRDIHHIVGLEAIMSEVLDNLSLPLKKDVGEYSEEEIKLIDEECKLLHEKYGAGVLLCRSLHLLYHSVYGWGGSTPSKFLEFYYDLVNGKYNDHLQNNNIILNINPKLEQFLIEASEKFNHIKNNQAA